MQVTRLPTEPGETDIVYQVRDTETIQNVFFLIVSPDESSITVASLSPDGTPDEADTILVASRLGLDAYEPGSDTITWPYESPEDLGEKLEKLLGQHSSIVMTDLGFGEAQDPNSPDWQSGMEKPESPTVVQSPDLVAAKDFEFSFDPTPLSSELAGDEEGSDGLGGGGGEFDFAGDEGELGDEPLPDELEDPTGPKGQED